MKKLLLIILLISSPVFAFEDYIIISNNPVKSVSPENSEIVDAKALFTIDNQKKTIIVTPKQIGNSTLNIKLNDGKDKIEVKVTKESTTINAPEGYNCYVIDSPPAQDDIPMPPTNIKTQPEPEITQ